MRPVLAQRPPFVNVPASYPLTQYEDDLLARIFADLRRWTEMPRGGHFAALEQPDLLVDDVRAFFRGLR